MPALAACRTCTPLLMPLARPSSDWAVKKLVGLSSAVFTFLPVERRLCVVASRSAVDCSESKFWRTEDERTIPDILLSFWMNTIDATPHVSVGDRVTLFSQRYPFVKSSLRTNTHNNCGSVQFLRTTTDKRMSINMIASMIAATERPQHGNAAQFPAACKSPRRKEFRLSQAPRGR